MKKAFTLVELLGVIIILGVLALITFPIIDKSIKQSKEKALQATIANIEDAANKYSVEHDLGYSTSYQKMNLSELVNSGYLKDDLINPVTNSKLKGCVLYKWDEEYKQYEFKYDEECVIQLYKDNSGANSPELLDNMIPIKYENDNWVVADTTQEWYDYNKKEWANAVILEKNVSKNIGEIVEETEIALWYVWIPRYTYTIFNGNNGSVNEQEIQIKFENGTNSSGTVECVDAVSGSGDSSETCTDSINGNIVNGKSTYTHPAFTFGDKELTGFWVGKFKTSTSDSTCNNNSNNAFNAAYNGCNEILPVTIKPYVNSWRNSSISNYFTSIKNIESTYNIKNSDSHMIKNMEWGALVYLTNSKYGRCNNGECEQILKTTTFFTGQSELYGYDGSDINNLIGNGQNVNPSVTTTGIWQNINGVWSFEDEFGGSDGTLTFDFIIKKFGTISFKYTNEDLEALDNCLSFSIYKDEYKYVGTYNAETQICGNVGSLGITKDVTYNLYPGKYKIKFYLPNSYRGRTNKYVSNLVIEDGFETIKNVEQGVNMSTTGNVYGVYDMNNNVGEYVMGNVVNNSGEFNAGNSGFSVQPDSRYYDSYTYNTSYTTHGLGKLGDATKETLITFGSTIGGWYNSYASFPSSSSPWFTRHSFYFTVSENNITTRAVICSLN